MNIELVEIQPYTPATGIGRYATSLVQSYPAEVQVKYIPPAALPFSRFLSFLKFFPLYLPGHAPGSAVHYPQILGASMQIARPYHPAIATVHDVGFLALPEEWRAYDPLRRLGLRLSMKGLKHMDKLLANSEFTRQELITRLHIPPDQVVTVYPGIDPQVFHPILHARRHLSARYAQLSNRAGLWLLYVGSELPRKNFPFLLQILAELKLLFPEVTLLKVGAPGSQAYRVNTLSKVNAVGLSENVFFFDSVPETDLPLFYAAADLFLTTSRMEGFCFPVLEAMACGTPVIYSAAGSLPEVTGGAALQVETFEVKPWLEAIQTLTSQPGLRSDLSACGIAQAARFTWEETAGQVLQTLQALVQ